MNNGDQKGALPGGWALATLEQIADCRLGKMLDQAKNRGDLRPYLRNVNVQWGRIDLDDIKEMRITQKEAEQYAVRAGDLLVCEGGEPGRCAVWIDDREMYLQKALHRVRPRYGTSPEYLRWWLQDAARAGRLEALYTGSTIKHLPGRQLVRVPVALPPVPEQRRIVVRIAEIELRRTTAAARLHATRTMVGRLRGAVIAAACSGRLTEAWREENGRGESQGEIPANWVATTLQDLSSRVTSGPRDWAPYYGRGRGTFVMAQNVRRGELDWSSRQAVDPPPNDPSRRRCQIARGDLLVTIVGANTGDVAPVLDERPEHYVCQSVALVRPTDQRIAEFLNLWFNSPFHGRKYLDSCIYGAGRPHLSFKQLKAAPVSVPPIEEQREIVRRVSITLTAADHLAAQIRRLAETLDRVSHAALAKAFRGELVPTEAALADKSRRGFESAEALLARVGPDAPTAKGAERVGRARTPSA